MTQQDMGQTIKEMSEIDFPEGLHGKILRQIVFLRFRAPFIIVVTLLSLNLIISGWRMWEQLLDSEVLTTISILWGIIEFNFSGVMEFLGDMYEILPLGQLALLGVNGAVLVYVVFYIPRAMRKLRSA